MKRILSFLCISVFAFTATADETSVVNYGTGTTSPTFDLIWQYKTETTNGTTYAIITGVRSSNAPYYPVGELVIPESVVATNNNTGYIVKGIGDGAFANQIGVTTILIPVTVESIGTSVFTGCTVLSEITVDDGNPWFTSLGGALYDKALNTLVACPAKTTSLTLPEKIKTIGNCAFDSCFSLVEVIYLGTEPTAPENIYADTPEELTSFVRSGAGFQYSSNTWKNRRIEQWIPVTVPVEVTVDSKLFIFNWQYKVDLDSYTAELITVDPKPINEVEVPNAIVGTIGGKTYSFAVTKIGDGAFRDAQALTKVTVSAATLQIGDYAFSNCTALAEIELSYGLKYIGKRPFVNTSIANLTLPDTLLEMDGNIAAGTIYDMTINISDSSHFTHSNDGALYNKDMTKLYSCPTRAEGTIAIPSTVTNICTDAFFGCFRLSYLNIPENVVTIGDGAFNASGIWPGLSAPESTPRLQSVFYNGPVPEAKDDIYEGSPSELTSYALNDEWDGITSWKNRPVTVINEVNPPVLAYKDDNNIIWHYRIRNNTAEICHEDANGNPIAAISPASTSGSIYTEQITETTYRSQVALKVPSSINGFSVTRIGAHAFDGCTGLVYVGIPPSIREIGDFAFSGCTSIKSISDNDSTPFNMESGKINLPTGIEKLGRHVFEGVKVLSVSIPYTLNTMSGNPLAGMEFVSTVEVSASNPKFFSSGNIIYDKNRTTVVSVPANHNDTSISFPSLVAKIGSEALYGCENLTTIYFPASLTDIGTAAFTNCTSLSKVTYAGHEPSAPDGIYDGASASLISYAKEDMGFTEGTWKNRPIVIERENHELIYNDGTVTWHFRNVNGVAEITAISGDTPMLGRLDKNYFPKTLGNLVVKGIGESAFTNQQGITSIELPDTYEWIGDYAFSNCTSLASVTLPYNLRYIGKRPFVNTTISELTLPDTLLDMDGNIAAGAIYDMKINISDSSHFTYSDDGVLYNKDMTKLYSCPTRAEGTITIPSTVTNICQDAFFGCFRLSYLNIPENVTTIGTNAFNVSGIWPDLLWRNRPPPESTPKLQSVFYNGLVPEAADDIYEGAPAELISYTFTNSWPNTWKDRPVTVITEANPPVISYTDDNGIKWYYRIINGEAEIYNEDSTKNPIAAIEPKSTSGVPFHYASEDAQYWSNLWVLNIPSTINGYVVTRIGDHAFDGCNNVTRIGIPSSVKSIGDYAFKDCTAIKTIAADGNDSNSSIFFNDGEIELPTGIRSLGYQPFEGLKSFSVSIPYTVNEIVGNPLAGMEFVTSVEVAATNPKFYSSGNVIYNKSHSKVVGVPANYDGTSISFLASVTEIGAEALHGCANLKAVTLPAALETISSNAFAGCASITSLTVPATVTSIEAAFDGCDSLSKVSYDGNAPIAPDDLYAGTPESLTSWAKEDMGFTEGTWKDRPIVIKNGGNGSNDGQSVTIGDVTWYFRVDDDGMAEIWRDGNKTAVDSDKPIMSLSLPDTLGGYVVKGIGDGALSNLRGITSITVPNTYEWIGDYAFSNCTSLASASLGNGVERIGRWPFYGTKLTTLNIPDSVSEIDGNPVAGCSLMQAVTAADSQPNFSVADGLLYDKRKETLYACPATKTAISLPESLKQINDDTFYGCNLNDDSYVIVDGVTWGFTSASDGGAKITSVQNADGTITIPASLAGRPVTEIEDSAFADCGEVKAFVSKSPAFKARNGVLYSADGKDLICVPNMMRLPYTVKTSTSTATIEEHSEAGVRGRLPYVDVTTTTNVSATTTTTEKFNGDISTDTLLAGVTHIRDYAFSGVNVFTNTYDAVTNGPSIGSAIPGDGKVNSYVITTSFDIESVEYSTILTVNQATTTVAPNATTDSGVEIVLSNTPRGSTEPRLRVSNTSGLPPSDAVSVYDGFITDASDDVAGTAQVKLAKPRNGKAIVTMTLLPANAKKITAKGILDTDSGVVSGLDISLGSIVMYGTYGGYSINGARNLSKSKNKDEAAKSAADLKFWLGAVNVAWEDGTLTATIAAKGKAKISGTLANGTKVSVSSQAINFGDRLCVPIVVPKKASVSALLWLPLNTGEGVEVEGLGDTAAGKPGSIRPRAEFQLDRSAVAKLALDEASIPLGGITTKGTQWSINDGTGRVALKLRYTAKTGALKGTFKAVTEQNGRRKNTSVSVTGVVIGDSAYGFATVKKSGSAPFEIK